MIYADIFDSYEQDREWRDRNCLVCKKSFANSGKACEIEDALILSFFGSRPVSDAIRERIDGDRCKEFEHDIEKS